MNKPEKLKIRDSNFLIAFTVLVVLLWCSSRVAMEWKDDKVTVVMSRADIELLAEAIDVSADEYLSRMRANNTVGLPLVIEPGSADNDLGLFLWDDKTELKLPDGVSLDAYLAELGATVGLIEDSAQYSFVQIPGFEPIDQYRRPPRADAVPEPTFVPMVRVFKLFPDIAARYAVLGYKGAEELVNIFCRAIVDRSIRVVWLTPYTHSETGEQISDPAEYGETIERMSTRLRKAGLTVGAELFAYEEYSIGQHILWLISLLVIYTGLELLSELVYIRVEIERTVFIAMIVASAIAFAFAPELAVGATALGASIIFPCIAMRDFVERLTLCVDSLLFTKFGYSMSPSATRVLLVPVLISVLGGLVVGVLQSSTRYLLAIDNFRGVKISQAVPLIFAVLLVAEKLGDGVHDIVKRFRYGRKRYGIAAIALFAVGAVYFILRTGDGFVQTSVLEQRFRNVLETALAIRPRTKEFMIAWPCMLIAYILFKCRAERYAWPFVIVSMTGFSSVVNTFCHSRAHLTVSGLRTIYGLVFGLMIGLPLSLTVKRVLNGRRAQ